jgi:ATP-dependent exoDNAse (exonuclease V) beta subunit
MMGVAAGHLHLPRGGEPAAALVETHAKEGPVPAETEVERDTTSPRVAELSGEDRRWVERGRVWLERRPDTSLARQPAVLSVSAAKQQAMRGAGEDVPRDFDLPAPLRVPAFARPVGADAQAMGNAYHRFMQLADLQRLGSAAEVQRQIAALVTDGRFSSEEARLLSVDDVVWFAGTDEGCLAGRQAGSCRREVPFVYALPVSGDAERTVLRGVIDCLLESGAGLVILDYKTDRRRDAAGWQQRIDGYSVQLQLYAVAAAEVFGRDVARAALVFLRERRVVSVPVKPITPGMLLAWVGDAGGAG